MNATDQKTVQIVGNKYIHMENSKTVNNELVYTIRNGALVMQLNKESAELVSITLQEWLKQEDNEETKLRMLRNKANQNSSKKYPLGDDSEEHS
ncbi:hypothetical protein CKA55_12480 [Arcobacter suis]|uniref:Uncharacterized protein n=1 Tax=Arcobacter suis CECT 7833 TaxID=663365 RepID=A0AAD0SQ55_9BACT|nr:hypothetical protein [Arcobacter suis]AXX89377.1 hypothetical protein ASUIS_0886 [Arcobacter suis CECT 7833]RWS45503.1 hypothetical protein CKA55_12480 [Arcobacter suis]